MGLLLQKHNMNQTDAPYVRLGDTVVALCVRVCVRVRVCVYIVT